MHDNLTSYFRQLGLVPIDEGTGLTFAPYGFKNLFDDSVDSVLLTAVWCGDSRQYLGLINEENLFRINRCSASWRGSGRSFSYGRNP